MAVGDVNGDGYADIAAGATGTAQAVYVFAGSKSGVATTACGTLGATCGDAASTLLGVPEPTNNQFGYGIAVNDLNGDGLADLVANDGTSAVYVFPSAGGTGVPNQSYTSAAATFTGSSGSQLGDSLD